MPGTLATRIHVPHVPHCTLYAARSRRARHACTCICMHVRTCACALRAQARELDEALAYLDLFVGGAHLLTQMNSSIKVNGKAGLYDGCKVAVQCALEK